MSSKLRNFAKSVNAEMVRLLRKNPPEEIPLELLPAYTLNGSISVEYKYYNCNPLLSLPIIGTKGTINEFIRKIEKRETDHYPSTDKFLYQALEKHPVNDASCVVMGSVSPFYETMCLYFGAADITTIEYNRLLYFHSKIKTITPQEYKRKPSQFDVGFSISSFEHDGLGRYGDPLNPDGDFLAMQKMKSIIKRGGLLFLVVPVGKDCLVWNAHRIYGEIRLPKLLDGWEVIDSFGFKEEDLREKNFKQPVFVLKNKNRI